MAMQKADAFFLKLRGIVVAQLPESVALFDTLHGEAMFARNWLDTDLQCLPQHARILEVGGGAFLLSCLLTHEGWDVTSIEPVGNGFGEFALLAKLILENAPARPTIAECRAEDFTSDQPFDFAFSVNVMEHVDSVQEVIARVDAALKPGASYRFFCPNYLFPYEPHFNIPIIVNKQTTYVLLHRRIREHAMPDAAGTWASLNWITVPAVRRIAQRAGMASQFDTRMFGRQIVRSVHDTQFAARRGKALAFAMSMVARTGLYRLLTLLPASLLPTMDVTLSRTKRI